MRRGAGGTPLNSTFIQVAIALAQAVALIMSVAFITYVVMIVVPFSRHRPRLPGTPARWPGTSSCPR